MKMTPTPPSAQRTFYGYFLGFGGSFLRGSVPNPAYNNPCHLSRVRERVARAKGYLQQNHVSVQQQDANTCVFRNTVIYCDPPYMGVGVTNSATSWNQANEKVFWQTVRRWVERRNNNIVLVSCMVRPPRQPGLRLIQLWCASFRARGHMTVQTDRKGTYRAEYVFKVVESR